MASSMSAVLPPPSSPKPSNSDLNEEEEYEYEEIEVEEEVEVEEEIEEEVSDESDIGEDLTPVREEIQGNGIFQVMEPKEQEEPIKSSSGTVVGISISKPPTDIPKVQESVGDSRVSESSNKDLTHVKGEETSENDKPNVSFEGSGVNDMKRKHSEGNGDVALAMNDVQSIVVKTNPTPLEFEEDMLISSVAVVEDRQISPRLHAPLSWLRGSSSIAEVDGENKRQRIVCEFYAKGWCIKGKACRFLHTMYGLQISEVKKEASSSAFMSPHYVVENPTLNGDAEMLVLGKDNELSSSLLPPGRESRVQNSYSDNFRYYAAPPVKDDPSEGNSTYPGSLSGRFDVLPEYLNHASGYSTFGTSAEEVINRKGDLVQDHCSSMSHHQPRQPISYSLSPWNIDAFGTKNHLKSSLEHHATVSSFVPQITSPFSCSGSENLLRNRCSKYGTKVSSCDWEPSVHFRPSHDITRNLLLKEGLYDPIHDSIEQKEIKAMHVKSSSGEGSSMHNVHKKSHISEENRGLNAFQVEDSGKQNVGSSSYDNRLSYEKPGNEIEMIADEPRKNDESDIDSKKDEHLVNEEKPHKSFQTELIDYIKELLKPTWREGLMTKDAYKLIVKKSSDKVLSSMQPDQIPFTSDSIKLYLSSSESKLAKLVEAYIEKYGKC